MFGDEVVANERRVVCFGARSGARSILVAWRFEVEGGTVEDTGFAGCVNVFAGTADAVTIGAFADGLSTSVTLPVVKTSRKRDVDLPRPLLTPDTAGERAAMH